MTCAFTHRKISPSSLSTPPFHGPQNPCPRFMADILASRPKFYPQGSNFSFKAQIPPSRLKSQSLGPNPRLEAQIPVSRLKSHPRGSNHHLQAPIPASRPQFQPPGSNKNSIGHRLLRGRCPSHHLTPSYTHIGATGTADHLTLLRLSPFLTEALTHLAVSWKFETKAGYKANIDKKLSFALLRVVTGHGQLYGGGQSQ